MKISTDKPPLYEHILQAGMVPSDGTIYTYGDTIYNPTGQDLPDHMIEHEECHMRQQGSTPDIWWSRYLDDMYFRIEQETEAYAHQYAFICKTVKDRNQRFKVLHQLAVILSGPIYGNVIGYMKACVMIRDAAKDL